MREDAVEEFLSTVAGRLQRLPAQQRADDLRELRQHLSMLVEGFRAEGLGEAEAARAAVARFGQAEELGRALQRAGRRPAWHAVLGYLSYSLVQLAALVLVLFAVGAPVEVVRSAAVWPGLVIAGIAPAGFLLVERVRRERAAS